MPASHTPARDEKTQPDLTVVSAAGLGLNDCLAGRLDGHLATFAEHVREGLLAASTAVGLEVMAEMMAAEVDGLVGPKGSHNPGRTAVRHGSGDGSVTLGGRRLPTRRPRVRSVGQDATEVELESYATFADADLLAEGIVGRMLAGISTRRYPVALEPVGQAVVKQSTSTSTSKSAVSRRFVTATAQRLTQLCARRLCGRSPEPDICDHRKPTLVGVGPRGGCRLLRVGVGGGGGQGLVFA